MNKYYYLLFVFPSGNDTEISPDKLYVVMMPKLHIAKTFQSLLFITMNNLLK